MDDTPSHSVDCVPSSHSSNQIPELLLDGTDWCRQLLDDSADLLCAHDLKGRLLSINHSPARILGYTAEEMLKIPMREFLPINTRRGFDSYLEELQQNGEARGCMALLTRGGELRHWEYYCRLRTEGLVSPVVFGVAHDITDRVQTERALRSSENKFRNVFRDAPVGMAVASPDGRFLEVNQSFCEFLGYSADELKGMNLRDVTHPDDLESSGRALQEAYSGGGVRQFQKRYLHKTGGVRWAK